MSRSLSDILAELSSEDRAVVEREIRNLKERHEQISTVEERLQLAMKSSRDGIFDWNLKDNTIYYNTAWKNMLGYQDHEIKNDFSEWERLTDSEDVKRSWAMMNDCFDKKRDRFDIDIKMKHKHGHWVYVHSRANVYFDANGEPSRVVGVHVNVSARKHAEFNLLENQNLLSTLINNMPDIVCFKDGEGRWMVANDFAREVFQLNSLDYVGKDDSFLADHLPLNRQAFMECQLSDRDAWENESPWRGEETLNLETGGQKVFDIIKVPVFHEDKSRKGMLIIGRDVTEQKRAEEALKENGMRLEHALTGGKLGLWDWNLRTDEVFFDSTYYTIAGYEPDEFPHHYDEWEKRVHPEDIEKTVDIIKSCLSGNLDGYHVEFRFKRKDGSWMWIAGKGKVSEREADDTPVRFIGTHQDITQRKMAENELLGARQYFKDLYEYSPISIWLEDFSRVDKAFNELKEKGVEDLNAYIDQNPALLKDLGYSIIVKNVNMATLKLFKAEQKNELLNSVSKRFTKKSYRTLKKILVDFWEGKSDFTGEGEILTLDGEARQVLINLRVIRQNSETLNDVLVSLLDITDLKKTEQKLLLERNTTQSYLDVAGLIVVIDKEGIVTLANKRACEILGYPEEEVVEKNWFDHFLPERMRAKVKEVAGEVFKGKQTPLEFYENPVLTKSGEERLIAWHNNVIRDENGQITCTLSAGEDITEKKQAEERLKESEERFRHVVSNSDAVVFIFDSDGVFQLSEGKALPKIGLKPGEVVGLNVFDVYGDYEHVVNAARRSLSGERVDTKLIIENVGFNVYFNPVYSDSGDVSHVVGVATDISAQMEAEQALKFSESRYRTFFEKGHDGIVVVDHKTRKITEFNEQVCRQLGYTREEFTGLTINDIDATESVEDSKKRIQGILESGFSTFETVHKTRQGELRNVLVTTQVIDIEGHEFCHCIWRDITERKKAEVALRESEEKYRLLVENQKDLVVQVDRDFNFQFVSPSYCELFGKTEEDLLGKSFLPLVHEDDREKAKRQLESLCSPPYTDYHEQRAMTKDGWRWIAWKDSAVVDEGGNVKSYVGIGRDITDKKYSEKIILENQRLGAISEMSSAVAHDFNNALQSIFGNLELCMLNPDIPEAAVNYLKAIKTASEDAATRVQMLQRFGGKKKGESTYHPINLNTVVKDVIEQSRPLWKNRAERDGLVFNIETSLTDIPRVSGNDGELRSVLFNILKNAIEAMPAGGLINLHTLSTTDSVTVSIQDSGVGMDQETASRIFQPFFSTKGFEMGRGFGMSSAYTIIKEHGGTIKVVKSVPGEGTVIEITLPVIKHSEHIMQSGDDSEKRLSGSILWVDDEPHVRKLAEKFLSLMGHEGDVVSGGEEALALLKERTYDLVITDIGMPVMNGWELAGHIRDMFQGRMKVAVITGWGAQIEDDKRREYSVGYVLGKPVKLDEVRSLIQEALQN